MNNLPNCQPDKISEQYSGKNGFNFADRAESCKSSRGLVMSLLEVKNLRIEYPSRHGVHAAVKSLSFSIERGEIVGVVGEWYA